MDPIYRETENVQYIDHVIPSLHRHIVFFVKYKLGKLELASYSDQLL